MTNEEYAEFRRVRRAAGQKIDPATAVVFFSYGQVFDPYDVGLDVPDCLGRQFFARSPESDICVHFDDLPEATSKAIWEMHKC